MMSITAEFEVVFGIQFKMPQNGCETYEISQWTPSICVFVLLRQGFVSVVARISFGMLIDPVTVAVRAWLSACPSVASDVDRQLTLCELVPVGWCCQGWLGEPKDNNSPKQQRGDMPCHQATVTAGWSWQPHHCVAGNCLYIFSRHTKGETHVNSIYPQAHPRIRSTNIHEVGHTVYLTNYTCEWTHHCRASCLQPVSVSLTSHIINLTEGTCHKGVSSSAIFFMFPQSVKYKYNQITQTQINDTIILHLLSQLKWFI